VELPSEFFFKNGHLNTNSQQAPQRLHSPRRNDKEATVSALKKFVFTNRRILPWAWRARSFASEIFRERSLWAKRSSKVRCFVAAALRVFFI